MTVGEVDVAIVGAGAAGIAAARWLVAHGRSCVMLEATDRVGGRALTSADGLGTPLDHGASWLHAAEHNPLTPIAAELGFTMHHETRGRRNRLLLAGRDATPEEHAAHDAACAAWDEAAARAVEGPDRPLAEVVPRDGPWDATAAYWHGSIINAAEPEETSLHDYVATGLEGGNIQLAEGLGTLMERLAAGLPLRLGAAVTAIGQAEPGGPLDLRGDFGHLRARGCIVTASTAVLAAGAIAFTPAPPEPVRDAIAGLPLGLLSKVALRAAGPERLGLPAFARLSRRVEGPGDHSFVWMLWPFGRDHVVGFIGGAGAWALACEGQAAAEAAARADLARYFGAEAVARTFAPGAVATGWAEVPWVRGAYSHAVPGAAGARAVLRDAALAGRRLRFAGEACHERFAATLGGAWASGEHAAAAVAAAL